MEADKDSELPKAEGDLAKAEADVKQAERDLERAEGEVREAEHEIEEAEHHREPLVQFEDVNALQTVDFHTPWETKLNAAWNTANELLKEPRKPTDRLQTSEGADLMPYLELTLHELKERKIITSLKFQIVGPTGGA
jgi:multidrug resistance efflux pump